MAHIPEQGGLRLPDLSQLQRQRRFLVVISLAVVAFYAIGAQVEKAFTFQGVTVTLAHPQRLVQGMWLVWLWAFIRYAQRVYELLTDIRGDIREDVYAEEYRVLLNRVQKWAQGLAASRKLDNGKYPVMRVTRIEHAQSGSTEKIAPHPAYHFKPLSNGGRQYTFNVHYRYESGKDTTGGDMCKTDFDFTPWQVRRLIWRSWYHGILRLPAISEHIIPFIIAVIAFGSIMTVALIPVLAT